MFCIVKLSYWMGVALKLTLAMQSHVELSRVLEALSHRLIWKCQKSVKTWKTGMSSRVGKI